jgi:uncharacterized protein (DUF885 family)
MEPLQASKQAQETLNGIADNVWEHWLEQDVYLRMVEGLKVSQLPQVSHEEFQEEAAFDRSILDRLAEVARQDLPYADQITLDTLTWDFERRVEQADFFWLMSPVTPYASPLNSAHRVFSTYTFEQNGDLDDYVALLRQYPSMVDDVRIRVVGQRERGVLLPKDELGLVIPFLRSVQREPAQSLFYIDPSRLEKFAGSAEEAFIREIGALITGEINPALERLIAALSDDYAEAAPDEVGLHQYPDGEAFYRALIHLHTTVPLSPEEIHTLGLEAVDKLDEKMAALRQEMGVADSKAEFHAYLKSGPRFFAETPEEVGARLMGFIRQIEPHIDTYFARLPQAPYGVKRLEPHLEGSMTFGYYDLPKPSEPVGYYYYNGSNLADRSLYNAAGLIYHELVPGHHFQIALQMENESLPKVRRMPVHSAYVEGWAEYAAELAREMGMYQDPYDLYGRLVMDMFLAVRLVVDSGMNHYGWPRSRAMAFMRENVLESETQIHTETLRYAVDMPGQALAYKIGSMKMQSLRGRVEKELGARFDIRRYHEAVLKHGSMPLSVLEQHMDSFIAWESAATDD